MAPNILTMIPNDLNISSFAEHMETIKMLYEVDDDFKTLCDDFLTSKKSFEKFKEKTEEDKQLKKEYKRLSGDLEKEIMDYVMKRR